MTFTTKDKIALAAAILLGTAFGYLSVLAGFGGGVVGAVYGILIVPLIVIFVADRRKILVWQACVIPYAVFIALENKSQGAPPSWVIWVFCFFWAMGTALSSPAPAFFYWKAWKSHRRKDADEKIGCE